MNNTLKKITLAFILITLSAFSLCLVACGGDSLSSELQEAKEKIESQDAEEVFSGWIYLLEHKDEDDAAKLIDSLGGIPTPSSNISQLYRMTVMYQPDATEVEREVSDIQRAIDYFEALKDSGLLDEVNTRQPYSMTYESSAEHLYSIGSTEINCSKSQFGVKTAPYTDREEYKNNPSRKRPFFFLKYSDLSLPKDLTEEEASAFFHQYAEDTGLEAIQETGDSNWQVGKSTSDISGEGALWFAQGGEDCPYLLALYRSETVEGKETSWFGVYFSSFLLPLMGEASLKSPESPVTAFDIDDAVTGGNPFTVYDPDFLSDLNSSSNSSSSNDTSSDIGNNGEPKDRLITETDGKYVYRVYAAESNIHLTGSYTGSGHFSIEVLNSNQKLHDLAANEIGDHKVDTRVSVRKGEMYYIQIEWTSGTWNLQWTGTGGS